jgi:hypothetical protein
LFSIANKTGRFLGLGHGAEETAERRISVLRCNQWCLTFRDLDFGPAIQHIVEDPAVFNGGVTQIEDAYTNANLLLRPGRVAVLFRGGGGWRARARLAISVAGKYWGGGGFILVPFDDSGAVSSLVLSLVKAYDPDHVVLLRLRTGERDRVAEFDWNTAVAQAARSAVADACTPFRRTLLEDEETQEKFIYLEHEPRPTGGQLVSSGGIDSRFTTLACSENWDADSSMALAIRTGVLPLGQETRSAEERLEPVETETIPFLFNPQRWSRDLGGALEEALRVDGFGLGPWPRLLFDGPEGGLTPMSTGYLPDGASIVVGDSADDFAMAYAYERLLGFGVWLTPRMITDSTLAIHIGTAFRRAAQAVGGVAKQLTISSSTLTDEELEQLVEGFKEANPPNPFGESLPEGQGPTRALPQGVRIGPPRVNRGRWQLAVADPTVKRLSVPISIEPDGTTTMRTPMESPLPATLLHQEGIPMPYWYISADFPNLPMPKGRGVPQEFIAPSTYETPVPVRSGRDGLSFHSRVEGLVVAGMQMNAMVQEPRLRVLSMHRWVQTMARHAGMEARLSQPGMNARLVEGRLGGRNHLISEVSGVFHPALMKFATLKDDSGNVANGTKSSVVFPDHDGVVLGGDPYPSFKALSKSVVGIREEDLKNWIDRLTKTTLLRRGLVLHCQECGRASFVPLDSSGQRFECARCSANNELTSGRWRTGNEPRWFYDLHPSFREILAEHGDVGLFAARALQVRGRGSYSDVAEMEFRQNGNVIAEIDLISYADGEVVLAEAKSNNRLGSNRKLVAEAARKKVSIAAALCADRLIIATSQAGWAQGTLQALESAKSNQPEAADLAIELMVGLGPDSLDSELSFDI